MVLAGIGNDLIDIRRVEKTLERFGERFTQRVFTEVERKKSDRRKERAASYAKRFAAKEACAKALGTGISGGIRWTDLEVVLEETGAPQMALSGEAAEKILAMVGEGRGPQVHLSLSDEKDYAIAFVVLSSV